MIRTFLAVELPVSLKQALASVQADVKRLVSRDLSPGMRVQWVRPDSIHLTVKFLGDIPEEQVDDFKAAVQGAVRPLPPFPVDVAGLGVFPDLRAPRVLWIGLSSGPIGKGQATALSHLVTTIEHCVEGLGYPPESRPFNPHLTLARIKEGSREVGRVLARTGVMGQTVQLEPLEVRHVALMRSERKPSCSVYTKLWEVPIGSDAQG